MLRLYLLLLSGLLSRLPCLSYRRLFLTRDGESILLITRLIIDCYECSAALRQAKESSKNTKKHVRKREGKKASKDVVRSDISSFLHLNPMLNKQGGLEIYLGFLSFYPN